MNDIELAALTELVESEQFSMEAENEQRLRNGFAPAYSGHIKWESQERLTDELKRRGILK